MRLDASPKAGNVPAVLLGIGIGLGIAAGMAAGAAAAVPVDESRHIVETLAADSMQGRGAGSSELDAARDKIRAWFEDAGVSPGLDGEWLQPFEGPQGVELFNVVGRVPGRGDGCLVVGAHYDGLGLGLDDSEHQGEVHNGADDNASGIAALVRVGQILAEAGDLEHEVVLVAFSGEEIGRLGSEHYVSAPPVPLEHTLAMLNIDTIGGLEDDKLIIFGTATGEEFPDMLRGVNHGFGFDLALNGEGAGASDHASFFAKGIPVLHFFTGAKATYHRPTDDISGVDIEGVVRVADYVAEIALYLATSDVAPTFRPVGAERLASHPAGVETKRRRVSFGSIPDFSRESGGILLSGVMPGGGAEAAGLEKGDLIVQMGELEIDTIYDFQAALAEKAPGDPVSVVYMRGGERRECEVVLTERK